MTKLQWNAIRQMSIDKRIDYFSMPEPNSGCWLWLGYLSRDGYPRMKIDGVQRDAHRVYYEHAFGPIPKGFEVDHLCRTRSCVNLAHLELVTKRENCLRGHSFAAVNARKTHCPNGHPYSGANLKIHGGARYCRACQRARDAARKRAA